MLYQTEYPCEWETESAKQLMLGLLIPMIQKMWQREVVGTLEEDLCDVREPWKPDAQRWKDTKLRRQGLEAMIHLLWTINLYPEDSPPFQEMESVGLVEPSVAFEFEATLWVILKNFAFPIGGFEQNGDRSAMNFLEHALKMFRLELAVAETASVTGEHSIELLH